MYAFGVLLGEVMTGEVPFLGYDYADLTKGALAAAAVFTARAPLSR